MKPKYLFLISFIAFSSQYCFSQDSSDENRVEPKQFSVKPKAPYYILKAGDKSAGVYSNGLGEEFDTKKYWDSGIVASSRFLNKEEGKAKYGELGANGVIILTFKNYATLPQELKDRFKDSK